MTHSNIEAAVSAQPHAREFARTTKDGGGDVVDLTMHRAVPTTARPHRTGTLDYIADLAAGLAEMAAAIDSPVLARLLALAEQEARRPLPDAAA